jgi:tetratricopeptide (TPR) repeat protein
MQAPTDLEARGWYARLLAWQGHWAEAEQEYREVLDRVPEDLDVLTGLADVLVWQKKLEEAQFLLDRAVALAPRQPDILLRRARLSRELGRNDAALGDYRQLLRQDPQSREARSELASLSRLLKNHSQSTG